MCIRKNTTTALIGPSGVGKTTVADLIVGLLEPTHGAIYIDKQRLHSENLVSWRKSVAYVTQTSLLLNASIRDNLQLFSGPVSEAALWRALHDVFAAEFVSKLDQGLILRLETKAYDYQVANVNALDLHVRY
jgi:ATP-binding cassette subfamily C protein